MNHNTALKSTTGDEGHLKEQYRRFVVYLVVGIILLEIAYLAFTADQPVVFRNESGQLAEVRDLTTIFQVVSWLALVTGLASLGKAIHGSLFSRKNARCSAGVLPAGYGLLRGHGFWIAVNVTLILLSIWAGSETFVPIDDLQPVLNLGFCVGILVFIPLFAIGTIHLAKAHHFLKPKWNRCPFNWWSDPLQALFVTTWCSFGMLVGSLFRFRTSDRASMWTVMAYVSIFVGFALGRTIVNLMYPKRGRSEQRK